MSTAVIKKNLKKKDCKCKCNDEPKPHIYQQNDVIVIISENTGRHTFKKGSRGIIMHINTAQNLVKYQIKQDFSTLTYWLQENVDFIIESEYKGELSPITSVEELVLDRFVSTLTVSPASNSCGIKELNSIGATWTNRVKPAFKDDIVKQKILDIFKSQFKSRVKTRCGTCGHVMISLPEQGNDKELIDLLDEICPVKSDWVRNPNSGHDIKIWIFN